MRLKKNRQLMKPEKKRKLEDKLNELDEIRMNKSGNKKNMNEKSDRMKRKNYCSEKNEISRTRKRNEISMKRKKKLILRKTREMAELK